MAKYLYDPGLGRFKHCWNEPHAGFVPGNRGAIGKCSNRITLQIAQSLLDDGIEYRDSPDDRFPSAIYNVYEGIPYEAAPTEAGKSFHGYPWKGTMARSILLELRRRAELTGHVNEFKRWVDQHSRVRI